MTFLATNVLRAFIVTAVATESEIIMNRILLAVGASAVVLLLATMGSCISFHNDAVKLENSITAQVKSNKAEYDKMWKVIAEVAQVPAQYKNDFKDLLTAETSAKFGDGGSKALAQWFNERDLRLPPEMYTKVQTVIEANRTSFKRGQDDLADKQRRYADHLGKVSGRVWSGFTGHPREIKGDHAPSRDIDGDGILTVFDYVIITSEKTEAVFESGQDNQAIDVFGNSK